MTVEGLNNDSDGKTVVLVGLSGCSSSGKSTIAKITSKLFPDAVIIHQDDFYKHDEEVPIDPNYKIQNWDSPEALDLHLLERELETIHQTGHVNSKLIHNGNVDDISKFDLSQSFTDKVTEKYKSIPKNFKVILLDGFMLYHDAKLSSYFDLKLLVRAPYKVLKERRNARPGYQTLDSFWKDPPYYFDEFVYKSYKESHAHLFQDGDVEGILILNSENAIFDYNNDDTKNIESSVSWVCDQIVSFCQNS